MGGLDAGPPIIVIRYVYSYSPNVIQTLSAPSSHC